MSESDWMGMVLLALVIGLAVGSFVAGKVIDWKAGKCQKELSEKEELYKFWRGRAEHFESMMNSAFRSTESAKAEVKEYRTRWADELQKRLDLADRIGRREEFERRVKDTVKEAAGRGESSADYPCD